MIIDGSSLFDGTFSTSAGLTALNQYGSDTTLYSTNVLDMINFRDLGQGHDMGPLLGVEITVGTAFSGGTSVNFQLQGSTDNSHFSTYMETGAITTANLVAGTKIKFPLPPVDPESATKPRYYRLGYVEVGPNTAGSLIAFLGAYSGSNYYPPGVVVNN